MIRINTDEKIKVVITIHEEYPVYCVNALHRDNIMSRGYVFDMEKSLWDRYEKAQKEFYEVQGILANL